MWVNKTYLDLTYNNIEYSPYSYIKYIASNWTGNSHVAKSFLSNNDTGDEIRNTGTCSKDGQTHHLENSIKNYVIICILLKIKLVTAKFSWNLFLVIFPYRNLCCFPCMWTFFTSFFVIFHYFSFCRYAFKVISMKWYFE